MILIAFSFVNPGHDEIYSKQTNNSDFIWGGELLLEICSHENGSTPGSNKNKKPTDQELKSYTPANRDFQRTEEEIERVSQSEKDEQKRERNKKKMW